MVCCDIACINIQRIDHCFKKIGYEIQLRNQPFEQFVDMYVLVNRYSGKFYFVCMIYQILISKLQTKANNKKLSHMTIPCTNIWVQTPHNMYRFQYMNTCTSLYLVVFYDIECFCNSRVY